MKRMATVRCLKCQATRTVPMEKYALGDVLQPYPGGGNYGTCLKCKRGGLQVIAIPRVDPIKPVGWNKIPEV